MNSRKCPTSKKKRCLRDCIIEVTIILLCVVGSFTATVADAFACPASSRILQNRAPKGGYTRSRLFNDEQRNENRQTESETAITSDDSDGTANTNSSKNQKKLEGTSDSNNSRKSKKSLDELLDQSFFDPDKVTEDDPAPVRWFADLVKNDYATAETLFSGLLFVVLVVVSQELLRVQMFGLDGYVPFQAGVRPGQLF